MASITTKAGDAPEILEESYSKAYDLFCSEQNLDADEPESHETWRFLSPRTQRVYREMAGARRKLFHKLISVVSLLCILSTVNNKKTKSAW